MTVKQDNWAERYQNSDHHSDRAVYNKVRYEDTTGWDFPEPAPLDRTRMARGRGGSYDQGVVTITRRRQLSLEPELDFALPHSRTAQRISNFAADDADVLSHHSRSKDRQLLNDITTRLVNTPYADQYSMKPPLPPLSRQPSVRRHVPRRLPESALFIRAGSLPPSSNSRIDFYEDDLPPPTPRVPIKRQVFTQNRPVYRTMSEPPPTYRPFYRAASEPPPYRPSAYETYEPIYRSSSIYDYDSEPLYRPRIYSYGRESLYRPRIYDYDSEPLYRPRIYDYASEPVYRPSYYPSSVYQATPYIYRPAAYRPTTDPRNRYTRMTPYSQIAVRNAKRYMDKIERELGMHENGPIIAEPVVIHHLHQSPRVVAHASPRVATVSSPRYRSSSLPPLSRGVPRSSRVADIEARLERDSEDYTLSPIYPKPESLSALRTRAVNIKNKMDTHKSMMDRYLPIYLGPENEVGYEVDYKYGELVNRMPSLDRHRPFQGSTAPTPVAPYRPASKSSKPPLGNSYGASARANFRPHVSETRKRIREVMCATKKDPHYYD